MKDKEKRIFEEWFEEKKENCEVYGNGDDFWVDDEIKKFCLMGYELGLKAGRPQWHDLRKDKNDLPKEFDINKNRWEMEKRITEHIVQNQDGERVCCLNEKWYYEEGGEAYVIAWCEIPTFDKE